MEKDVDIKSPFTGGKVKEVPFTEEIKEHKPSNHAKCGSIRDNIAP